MNMTENQVFQNILNIIKKETEQFEKGVSITERNTIPDTSQIPIENPETWFRIKDVTCVYVDMIGSTKLSATKRNHGQNISFIYRNNNTNFS